MAKIQVLCSVCGFLGSFFITPEQHREGAMARAERLQDRHECGDDPMRRMPGVVTIVEVA